MVIHQCPQMTPAAQLPAESGEAEQEWKARVTTGALYVSSGAEPQQCWRQSCERAGNTGSLLHSMGNVKGGLDGNDLPGILELVVCLNKPTDPLITWKSECHALSQVWVGYGVTYCIHFCCFDCQLLRATVRRVWSGDGLCALILCHGYKMTRLMLTMWLCGDKPWQFELSCGNDSCR